MRFRYLAALVAVALLVALPAFAQEQRGSIEGVVKDAQGGAVVGATVTAKMASALEQRGERVYGPGIEVVTDANGTYRFASLSPGRYSEPAAGGCTLPNLETRTAPNPKRFATRKTNPPTRGTRPMAARMSIPTRNGFIK
jgi:hypothetical protein